MARLDHLGESKAVAQLGAVIGRQFTYELLSEVTTGDEADLRWKGDASRVARASLYAGRRDCPCRPLLAPSRATGTGQFGSC